jgi:hypothetical protein
MKRFLDADAAAAMLSWENSGFSVDASVRIALNRPRCAELFSEPGTPPAVLRPGANGVVELSPFEFLDPLADLVPPSRHSPSGMSASGRMPRPVAMRSADMRRAEMPPATAATRATNLAPTTPRDAKGQAHGPGGRGVSFCVPGVWWRHPTHRVHHRAGADPEDPETPRRTARASVLRSRSGPPTDWGEFVQVHDDRTIFQASPDELPEVDIHSL